MAFRALTQRLPALSRIVAPVRSFSFAPLSCVPALQTVQPHFMVDETVMRMMLVRAQFEKMQLESAIEEITMSSVIKKRKKKMNKHKLRKRRKALRHKNNP